MRTHYTPRSPINVPSPGSASPAVRARKRTMDSLRYTYKDLRDHLLRSIDSGNGPPPSSRPNLLSALNGFIAERGFRDADVIGTDLRASYARNIQGHAAALHAQARSASYVSNRKSLLAQWRRCLLEADRATCLRERRQSPLQTALADMMSDGRTAKGTSRATGIPLATLKRWLKGANPNGTSLKWLPRLERYFALPTGALSDLVQHRATSARQPPVTTEPNLYRQRLRANCRLRYALKEPLPGLRLEWLALVKFKTSVSPLSAFNRDHRAHPLPVERGANQRPSRLAKQKGARWSSTSLPVAANPSQAWYAFDGTSYVPTAAINWTMVAQFLGWLQLPVEQGGQNLPPDAAQTLANFTRVDFLESYLKWRIERAGGTIHHGVKSLLTLVRGLCNPKTGFLTQSYGLFSSKAGVTGEQEWRLFCQESYEFAVEVAEEVSERLEHSRDPFQAIGPALDLANPLEAVADAVARLDAERPTTGGLREAVWARDRLLLKLLASNPLRDKNVRLMTFREDNTGHLRRVNGEWRILIPRHEFKNARGAARHRVYDMVVRQEVWGDIERYLRDYRPMLTAPNPGNPYLFVSSVDPTGPMHSLGKRFEALTRKYLAGCAGVGPHAMRHLVATAILKANPNDWAAAAWALHDLEETVRQHYVHLRCDDAQRWMKGVLDAPFARM